MLDRRAARRSRRILRSNLAFAFVPKGQSIDLMAFLVEVPTILCVIPSSSGNPKEGKGSRFQRCFMTRPVARLMR